MSTTSTITRGNKYSEETRSAAKRAQALRGRTNSVSPLTVTRVQERLDEAGVTPTDAISGMTLRNAKLYAGGSDRVLPSERTVALYQDIKDPFARGRGFVAICLALAGK